MKALETDHETLHTRFIFYRNNELLIFDSNYKLINRIQHDVVFIYKMYFTDKNKNFYKIYNDEPVKICQLKKRIFKIVEYCNVLYIIDVYGDIYKMINNSLVFLCGTLCSVIDVYITKDNILILDKYKRVRVCCIDGTIIGYDFNVDYKQFLQSYNNFLSKNVNVLFEEEIVKSMDFKHFSVLVYKKYIFLLSNGGLHKISHQYSDGNIYCTSEGSIYRLIDDKVECIFSLSLNSTEI